MTRGCMLQGERVGGGEVERVAERWGEDREEEDRKRNESVAMSIITHQYVCHLSIIQIKNIFLFPKHQTFSPARRASTTLYTLA